MTEQDFIRAVESITPDEQLKRRVLSGGRAAERRKRRFQSAFRLAACAAAALVVFLGADYARSAMKPVGTAASSGSASQLAAGALRSQEVWNILLLGEDQPTSSRMRNNSMILLTVNEGKKSVLFSFFPCDLYVEIPKNGTGRLGEAYQLGGTELSKETLERNFGVTVHNTLKVSPDLLTNFIDSVGGVPVMLTKEEADGINKITDGKAKPVAVGKSALTGAAAYAYFTGNLGGFTDLGTADRQQKTVRQLVNSLRGMSREQLMAAYTGLYLAASFDSVKVGTLADAFRKYQNYTAYGFVPSSALAVQQQINLLGAENKGPISFVLVPTLPQYREVLQKMIGKGDFSAAQRLAG